MNLSLNVPHCTILKVFVIIMQLLKQLYYIADDVIIFLSISHSKNNISVQ